MTVEGMCWVCAAVCMHRGCRDSGMGAMDGKGLLHASSAQKGCYHTAVDKHVDSHLVLLRLVGCAAFWCGVPLMEGQGVELDHYGSLPTRDN